MIYVFISRFNPVGWRRRSHYNYCPHGDDHAGCLLLLPKNIGARVDGMSVSARRTIWSHASGWASAADASLLSGPIQLINFNAKTNVWIKNEYAMAFLLQTTIIFWLGVENVRKLRNTEEEHIFRFKIFLHNSHMDFNFCHVNGLFLSHVVVVDNKVI